jgi:hypothetical protein
LKQKGKNGRAEAGRHNWEPKVRRQSGSLKESSLSSLHFFFLLWFFLFSSTWEEKDARRKCLKHEGRSKR